MAGFVSRLIKWVPFGKVDEISPEELWRLIENNPENVQLIDVRSSREWKAGHIPKAVNIPITELAGKINSVELSKDILLVPICLSAHRSIPAVRVFKDLGYRDVRQLAGGMKSWNKQFKSHLVQG